MLQQYSRLFSARRGAVKVLCFIFIVGSTYTLAAEEPPELEEWFHIEGGLSGAKGNIFSYLPDFDTVGGRAGKNAIAVSLTPRMPTWYNRYQGDTIDQFNWGYPTRAMRKADLNGDGIAEYITRIGRIHQGIANGVPPQKNFIDYSSKVASLVPFNFQDIDGDGYIDIIADPGYFSKPWLFTVLWGGSDLTQLKGQVVYRRQYTQPKVTEFLAAVLPVKSAEGKVRIITRSYEESGFQQAKWISYVLREITAIHEADSVRFEIATLDSISDAQLRPNGESYDLFDGIIFQSNSQAPVLFITTVLGRDAVEVYCLDEGFFRKTQEFKPKRLLFPNLLHGSANGDPYNDFVFAAGTELYFYAGTRADTIDPTPYGYKTLGCNITEEYTIQSIGDVTGDGVGDIGEAYNNDIGCFRILKGIANRAVDVQEPAPGYTGHRSFELKRTYPNPVDTRGISTIPFTNEKPQHLALALYALDGRFIAEIFSGYVPQGEQEIQLSLKKYNLTPGMYVLRLSNGEFVRERGVLLQ